MKQPVKFSATTLQLIVEAIPNALVLIDKKEHIVFVNHQSELLFGYTSAQLIGKEIDLLIPASLNGDKPLIISQLTGSIKEEFIVHKNNGGQFLARINFNPITSAGENLVLAIITAVTENQKKDRHNATEMELAEKKRTFDKNNLDALINNTQDWMWSVDRDYNLITCNQPMNEIIAHTTGKKLSPGVNMLSLALSDRQAQMYKGFYDRAFAGECFTEIELIDNPVVSWSEISLYPICEGDKVMGAACHMRDISERKKAEDEIRKLNLKLITANGQLLAILNTLPANIALLDKESTIIATNEAWKVFARNNAMSGEFYGKGDSYIEICTKATGADSVNAAKIMQGLKAVLAGSLPAFSMEYPCDSPTEKKWFRAEVRPLPEQMLLGAVIMHFDITVNKLAELAVTELNETLETRVMERTTELLEAYQQLESFSYTVSHDLRSPLQAVQICASLFSKKYKNTIDVEGQDLLQGINDYLKHMDQLIRDLLNFSKIGKVELTSTPVDMNALMRMVIKELHPDVENSKVKIRLDKLKPALGDRGLLYQVCINLISNALKYSKKCDNPLIEIGMAEINGQDTYFVKDNGIGFDMGQVHRLFKAFQRLHKKPEYEGSGIGLALAHSIIIKHQGNMWAQSKPGGGATFFFTIPAA